jgi:hypothetical protein
MGLISEYVSAYSGFLITDCSMLDFDLRSSGLVAILEFVLYFKTNLNRLTFFVIIHN